MAKKLEKKLKKRLDKFTFIVYTIGMLDKQYNTKNGEAKMENSMLILAMEVLRKEDERVERIKVN